MRHFFRLLICVSFAFHFPLSTLHSQELPQGYFGSPLKGGLGLSATFAESRIGHFHAASLHCPLPVARGTEQGQF